MQGIIHTCEQRTPEWFALRSRCILTASEFGPFVIGNDKRAVDARRNAIIRSIRLDLAEFGTVPIDEWEEADKLRDDLSMERNYDVQRGNALEAEALDQYSETSGHPVATPGFVATPDGNFGCSPDGMAEIEPYDVYAHGIEIKCPNPKTLLAWHLDGAVPEKHRWQVLASIAITGLPWLFKAYGRGFPAFEIMVYPSGETDRLVYAMDEMTREKSRMVARINAIWKGEMP